MNRCSIRNLSLYARRLPVRPPSSTALPPVAAPASNRCKLRHLSTEFDSVDKLSSKPARSQDRDVAADGDDVTEEELKRRIRKFYDGDDEAIPSILEGILRRKLAGKNDEHLIEELPCKTNRGNEESSSDDEGID